MEYMLVLQWPSSSSVSDFDLLISLEDAIRESLGDLGTVDGHDIGSGEMNIFVFAEDPTLTFDYIKTIPSITSYLSDLKAGYRDIEEDEYTPIYPSDLEKFAVI